jgi:hypothetical protein
MIMRKVLSVFIGIFIGISSGGWAQDIEAAQEDLFLELRSGKTMRGEIIKNEPIFKKDYLLLNDSLKVGLDSVITYSTEDGYFTRITDRSSMHYQKFAERIEEGKIDLYSREFATGGGSMVMYGPYGGASYMSAGVGSGSAEFFSVNGEDVLKANYRNLKRPLSDNPRSMKHLNTYHDMGVASWVMIIGGLGIAGGSLTAISDEGGLPAGFFVGVGITGVGSILGFARQSHLPKAIRAYNE